jgi:tetratricopeptide (TPR) repeat protein
MNSRMILRFAVSLLTVCLFAAATDAREAPVDSLSTAAAKLRAMYFARDFEGGYVEGKRLVQEQPNSVGVKVWLVLNAARRERADEALDIAEKMKAANPDDGWGWFAYTGALNYHDERGKEALAASERMFSLLPGEEDAIWLRASVIRAQGKLEDALAFVDQHLSGVKKPAELLAVKASILYAQYSAQRQNRDESKLKASDDAFAEALKADPNDVNALYLQATYLLNRKKNAEALPLLRRALIAAPNSNAVHGEYWRAVNGMTDLSGDAKQKEIEADIVTFLKSRGNYVGALLMVSNQYEALKLVDKKREIDDRILQLEPLSRDAFANSTASSECRRTREIRPTPRTIESCCRGFWPGPAISTRGFWERSTDISSMTSRRIPARAIRSCLILPARWSSTKRTMSILPIQRLRLLWHNVRPASARPKPWLAKAFSKQRRR